MSQLSWIKNTHWQTCKTHRLCVTIGCTSALCDCWQLRCQNQNCISSSQWKSVQGNIHVCLAFITSKVKTCKDNYIVINMCFLYCWLPAADSHLFSPLCSRSSADGFNQHDEMLLIHACLLKSLFVNDITSLVLALWILPLWRASQTPDLQGTVKTAEQ